MTWPYLNDVDFSICSLARSQAVQEQLKERLGRHFLVSSAFLRRVLKRLVYKLCNALPVTVELTLSDGVIW